MDPNIHLEFTDSHQYLMEFSPPNFWRAFADSYTSLDWEEISNQKLSVIAVNYSYLLDLLVHARLYYLSTARYKEQFK